MYRVVLFVLAYCARAERVLKAVRLEDKPKKMMICGPSPETVVDQLCAEMRRVKDWATAGWKEVVKAMAGEEDEDVEDDETEDPVKAYALACQRYSVVPNGAVLSACRYGSKLFKPRGLVFKDADLLAVVDAMCESHFARGLDLTAIDGKALYAVGPALAHCATRSARGRGLSFLAVAENTPLGAQGASVLAEVLPTSPLRALKLAKCGLGDRGAESLLRAIPNSQLERIDLSANRIGSRMLGRLASLRSKERTVELRGNAAGLEAACAVTQLAGCLAAPAAGLFLASESRRLQLDPTAIASCAAYAACLTLYFLASAALHLSELLATSRGGDYGGIDLDALTRLTRYAAVAAAHAPFVAFVDLGLPHQFGLRFFGAASILALAAACWRPRKHILDPPALRPASTFDTVALALLGSTILFARLGPLKTALGAAGTRILVAAAGSAAVALTLDLRPANKPLAYLAGFVAAALHYTTVLTALVWHFLPPLE